MSTTGTDEHKKVTADKVQSALMEKDDLIREGVNYEDAFTN
jgi:hypothetical protein